MRVRRRRRLLAGASVLVVVLALALAFGFGGGGLSTATAVSPDHTYRVDWVRPNRLDRILHAGMSTPVRIELRNNITGRRVGVSDVVDADAGGNGQPIWLMKDIGVVSVGPGAQFLHVHPLAPDGSPLPIGKEYNDGEKASGRQ